GVGFWAMSGSKPEPETTVTRPPEPRVKPPPTPQPATPAVPEARPEEAQGGGARWAREAARSKSKESLDVQLAAWEEAARKSALTPVFTEASAGLQEIKAKLAAAAPSPTKPADPTPPPAPQKPAAEVAVNPAVWSAAMAKATAGDFEGAAAELRKDPAGAPEADELLRAGYALSGSRDELSKQPAGQSIALSYRGESGDRKRIEGTLLKAGPSRL